MDNLARKISPRPEMQYATVLKGADEKGRYCLELHAESQTGILARQSASCLLLPEPGDEVLASLDAHGRCYILAVLERAEPKREQQLALQGDVSLNVRQGSLRLLSEQNMILAAAEECACMAKEFSVTANDAGLQTGRARLLAGALEAQLGALRCVADTVETTARRLTQRLKDLFCMVEDQSDFQAANERHVVSETLTLHSKNAFHVADEIVKVDAEQVHLG